jgi:hypothetical protein
MHLINRDNSLKSEYKPSKLHTNDSFYLKRHYKIYNKQLNSVVINVSWSNYLPIRYENDQNNNLNINYIHIDIYNSNIKEYTLINLLKAHNKKNKKL